MEGFNFETGEFEEKDKIEVPKGKTVEDESGRRLVLVDEKMVFDPQEGKFFPRTKYGELKEVNE